MDIKDLAKTRKEFQLEARKLVLPFMSRLSVGDNDIVNGNIKNDFSYQFDFGDYHFMMQYRFNFMGFLYFRTFRISMNTDNIYFEKATHLPTLDIIMKKVNGEFISWFLASDEKDNAYLERIVDFNEQYFNAVHGYIIEHIEKDVSDTFDFHNRSSKNR